MLPVMIMQELKIGLHMLKKKMNKFSLLDLSTERSREQCDWSMWDRQNSCLNLVLCECVCVFGSLGPRFIEQHFP